MKITLDSFVVFMNNACVTEPENGHVGFLGRLDDWLLRTADDIHSDTDSQILQIASILIRGHIDTLLGTYDEDIGLLNEAEIETSLNELRKIIGGMWKKFWESPHIERASQAELKAICGSAKHAFIEIGITDGLDNMPDSGRIGFG